MLVRLSSKPEVYLRSAERSEVAPSIYEGFELRRTNIRKRLTVDLDCPTAVYLKAPLASLRAPI